MTHPRQIQQKKPSKSHWHTIVKATSQTKDQIKIRKRNNRTFVFVRWVGGGCFPRYMILIGITRCEIVQIFLQLQFNYSLCQNGTLKSNFLSLSRSSPTLLMKIIFTMNTTFLKLVYPHKPTIRDYMWSVYPHKPTIRGNMWSTPHLSGHSGEESTPIYKNKYGPWVRERCQCNRHKRAHANLIKLAGYCKVIISPFAI